MRPKTLEQITAQKLAGLQTDQLNKLRNGNMSFDQISWFNNLTYEQRQDLMDKQPEMEQVLKLISKEHILLLSKCDGSKTIEAAQKTFISIKPDFKNMIIRSKADNAAPETHVEVYVLIKNATFAQIFNSFRINLNKLCLAPHQITDFCEVHAGWLRQEGNSTFFLFKDEDQFLVAYVQMDSEGLQIDYLNLDYPIVQEAEDSHRLVVPDLTK